MNDTIYLEPLEPNLYHHYISLGTLAYNQHYKHLWPDGDTATYIQHSFTKEVLLKEEQDKNTALFLIKLKEDYAGILKITINKAIDNYTKREALYIDKIYITKGFTGLGIGKKTLQFVTLRAKELSKKVMYLEAMQKGPALPFYLANGFETLGPTEVPFSNVIEEEKPMFVLLKKV